MPNMTHGDSKQVLAQQRSQLRRGARGKTRIGQDTGSAAGQAHEREKVRQMQQRHQAEARRREPLTPMVADLVIGAARLAGTFFTMPFRLAAALRGHAPRAARA
jgi:hypothetical protein